MPELPEVETVRRGLAPSLVGARLVRVEARRPDLRFPLPEDFAARLLGARIEALDRRGKYLLATLDRGETLIVHLGMTGRFEIEGARRPGGPVLAAPADPKHAHIHFETDRGAKIVFHDARRFGFMDLVATARLSAYPAFRHMGPEPLEADFTADGLQSAFLGRRQGVKPMLLDQRVVAGLGNIYVCEALHSAGVSPLAPCGAIGPARLARIVAAVRAVLREAIEAGGSTLRDYAGADGALGYFQHRFEVYGRAGLVCAKRACGGIVRRIVQGGRATFYCPRCQK